MIHMPTTIIMWQLQNWSQSVWSFDSIFSSFCIISSWASFLIKPKVSKWEWAIFTLLFEIVQSIMAKGCFCVALFQIVPGRMGMLVTLFLSLTALLVSTISSSPEVTNWPTKTLQQCKTALTSQYRTIFLIFISFLIFVFLSFCHSD